MRAPPEAFVILLCQAEKTVNNRINRINNASYLANVVE